MGRQRARLQAHKALGQRGQYPVERGLGTGLQCGGKGSDPGTQVLIQEALLQLFEGGERFAVAGLARLVLRERQQVKELQLHCDVIRQFLKLVIDVKTTLAVDRQV